MSSRLFSVLLGTYLWYPRSRISGSYDNTIFTFLRNYQTIFHRSYTMFSFPQAVHRVPVAPHPFQCLLLSGFWFLIMIILLGTKMRFHFCGKDCGFCLGYVWFSVSLSLLLFSLGKIPCSLVGKSWEERSQLPCCENTRQPMEHSCSKELKPCPEPQEWALKRSCSIQPEVSAALWETPNPESPS
jgi:hypothetical protein